MNFEVSSRRTIIDAKGNDKMITELYLVTNATLFGEAETKILLLHDMENDVVAVKRSNIEGFLNEKESEIEQDIYMVNAEVITIDESENDTVCFAVYATSVQEAANTAMCELNKCISEHKLLSVKKTKIVERIDYIKS